MKTLFRKVVKMLNPDISENFKKILEKYNGMEYSPSLFCDVYDELQTKLGYIQSMSMSEGGRVVLDLKGGVGRLSDKITLSVKEEIPESEQKEELNE